MATNRVPTPHHEEARQHEEDVDAEAPDSQWPPEHRHVRAGDAQIGADEAREVPADDREDGEASAARSSVGHFDADAQVAREDRGTRR